MKIRRRSLLARAYFFLLNEEDRARPVTLCRLIVTVFVGLPLFAVVASLFLAIAIVPMSIEWLAERWQQRRGPPRPPRQSALLEWLRAKKRGVCPIVEFD